MARWIRLSGDRKVIRHHGMIFPTYDAFMRYYDSLAWIRSAKRAIKKLERGMR